MLDGSRKEINNHMADSEDSHGLLTTEEREALSRHQMNNHGSAVEPHQSHVTAQSGVSKRSKSKNVDSFVVHNKYGMGGNESEEDDDEILDKMVDKTP